MCGNCRSVEVNVDWYSAGIADSLSERRRARSALAAAADAAMQHLGLRATVYPGAFAMSVSTKSGAQVLVASLSDLQGAAQKLTGSVLDPLDPAQITALSGESAT